MLGDRGTGMATSVNQRAPSRKKQIVDSDLPPPSPRPGRSRFPYLLRAALLYALFNLVVSPLSLWIDIYSGWKYGHPDQLLLPFMQGSLFLFAIVLNSDSIFRAMHGAFVMEKQSIPWNIWGVVIANFISILVIFVLLLSRQQEALSRLLIHPTNTLPGQPGIALPDVGNQLLVLSTALFFGLLMNHFTTSSEISYLSAHQKGGK